MKDHNRMVGFKILLAAGAAAILFWRCLCRRKQAVQEEEPRQSTGEPRSVVVAHDISLEVIKGRVTSQTVTASHAGGSVSIGRLPHNSLAVADPKVSGDHAVITWNPEEQTWILVDAGSTNGTKLNDVVISLPDRRTSMPHSLRHGDVITIAEDVHLQVVLHPAGTVPPKPRIRSADPADRSQKEARTLSVAPSSGCISLTAIPPAPGSGGSDIKDPLLGHPPAQPRRKVVQHYFPGLEAELALASQVGSHHWQHDQGSEDVGYWQVPLGRFEKAGLFGICDGHFGPGAALQVQQDLPGVLCAELAEEATNLIGRKGCGDALHRTFQEVDARLKTEEGATSTLLLAERQADGGIALQASNVGDSAALLIDPDRRGYRKMTADHRVAAPAETRRLMEKGTPLTHSNTRMYMLNLARAMGDSTFKDMDIGLIAEPHVSPVYYFTSFQKAIVVMASDGLWDAVSDSEVVANIIRMASKTRAGMSDIAHALVRAAVDRGVSDDVTVCVVRFWPTASVTGKP